MDTETHTRIHEHAGGVAETLRSTLYAGPTDRTHHAIVALPGQSMTDAVHDGIGRHVTIVGALSVHDARAELTATLAPGELIARIC